MPRFPTLPRALPERPLGIFGIDLRSLAMLRALLGLLLLADLAGRAGELRQLYTDVGVLPRAWLTAAPLSTYTNGFWRLDLHAMNGMTPFVVVLFAIEVFAALALLIGWRTRLATLLAFGLQASLLNRNPLVVLPGDELLVCLLFWCLFLPLGARWSFDAALAQADAVPPESDFHLSWASAGLMLQVLAVCLFGALLQGGWSDGSALAQLLRLGAHATLLGSLLGAAPSLASGLAVGLHYLWLICPLLALVPFYNPLLRAIALGLLAATQIGVILLLRLGLLPWVEFVALGVLVGGGLWEALARRTQREPAGRAAPLRLYYDRDCDFCLKTALLLRKLLILPQAEIAAAQDHARAHALLQANHSWIVIDHDDRAWLKWPALALLLRRSPLFGPLGRMLGSGGFTAAGDALYDFIGRHRPAFDRCGSQALQFHRRPFETGRAAQRCAAVLLFVLLAWNIAGLQPLPRFVHRLLAPPLELLRIDQRWDWFAAASPSEAGWLVAPGTLADGSTVDVLHPDRATVSFDTPAAGDWPEPRWQRYFERLRPPAPADSRYYFGRYLCRQWNARHDATHQLRTLALKYILVTAGPMTGSDGAASAVEQREIWQQDCSATGEAAGANAPLP